MSSAELHLRQGLSEAGILDLYLRKASNAGMTLLEFLTAEAKREDKVSIAEGQQYKGTSQKQIDFTDPGRYPAFALIAEATAGLTDEEVDAIIEKEMIEDARGS